MNESFGGARAAHVAANGSNDAQKAKQLYRLENQHRELKRRVAELDRRAYLTPDEQRLVVELKKRKLAAKDAMLGLLVT